MRLVVNAAASVVALLLEATFFLLFIGERQLSWKGLQSEKWLGLKSIYSQRPEELQRCKEVLHVQTITGMVSFFMLLPTKDSSLCVLHSQCPC